MSVLGIAAPAALNWWTVSVGRRGRKRKIGRRHPSGQLVRKKTFEERMQAERIRTARQPHRRGLRSEDRFDERAESPLGRMLLAGKLGAGDEAAALHDAGVMYAQIVGRYRATIEAPRSTSGSGRGSACEIEGIARGLCNPETCKCLAAKRDYDGAFECVMSVGQRAAKMVARVAVHREDMPPEHLVYLVAGLRALAGHFGLTRAPRRAHYRNAH